MRWVTLALGAVFVLAACGVTDAESVWCAAHASSVAASADTLGLPAPQTAASWDQWAAEVSSGVLKGNLYDSLTTAQDRPNRDRACIAAYTAR